MISLPEFNHGRLPASHYEESLELYDSFHCYTPRNHSLQIDPTVQSYYSSTTEWFVEIQGTVYQHEVARESVIRLSRNSSSIARWSTTTVNSSIRQEIRRRRSESILESSFNELAIPQTVTREPNRDGTSSSGLNNNNNGANRGPQALEKPPHVDVAFLSALNTDSYIVPVEYVDVFVPESVPRPIYEMYPPHLNAAYLNEPKPIIVIHATGQFRSIEPSFESPLARPLYLQRTMLNELLYEIGRSRLAYEGLVMTNMERDADFPFMSFYVMDPTYQDPLTAFNIIRRMTFEKFNPIRTRYTAFHILDMFTEVASIVRPPVNVATRRPLSRSTGYVNIVFRIFEGEDRDVMERNWLTWTGARLLYYTIPTSAGLRRITLHKSLSDGDKHYVLLCEFNNFMDDMSAILSVLPTLRGRLCGSPGLFRTTATF